MKLASNILFHLRPALESSCDGCMRNIRGGRPRLIIHEYAVTFSGRGCGGVAEVVETQVLEARLACEGRLWMNHRENHEV